jgi:hypothetical protein
MKPTEIRQYLFRIDFKNIDEERKPLCVGKLDISWRYSFGENGRLQTHPLEQPVRFNTNFKRGFLNISFFLKIFFIERDI